MKVNGKIILFISITIFALIVCLFYLSHTYLYTNIVETFNTSQQYYNKKLPYVNNNVSEPSIYNQDVLNNNLPIIYDVDPTDVNLCYGDNKNANSLYTFPYIVLILRLQYLISNSGMSNSEYTDLCTVLSLVNNSISGTNGPVIIKNNNVDTNNLTAIYNYIINNSTNNKALLNPPSNIGKLYGTNLIKSCSRLYPNWLINPTDPKNSLQINSQPFPFINNGNGNQFADFYVNKTIPGGTSLITSASIGVVKQSVLSVTDPPSTNAVDPKILAEGAKSTTYRLDKFNFQNKNNEYCKRNTANTDPVYQSIEWTNEFALQNNISTSVEDKNVCLQLLLNPLTGDIIKCDFLQFNSKTLLFEPVDNNKQKYIYTNMLQLYDNTTSYTNNEKQKTWGLQPTPFKHAKLDKYIFDDCGRLYSVPVPVSGAYKFPGIFDLTQIFVNTDKSKDLYSTIFYYSSLLSEKPIPTYNIIDAAEIEKIVPQLIDNVFSLADFYTQVLYDNFTPSFINSLNTDTLDPSRQPNKSNVNGSFSYYFMKPTSSDDIYSNIANYTSSDGFIYINLGNIPGEINKDGERYTSGIDSSISTNIRNGITPSLLSGLQGLIMKQIIDNSKIINNNIATLQYLQTTAYSTINTIYYYLVGSGNQPGILGYLSSFKIPILSEVQISAARAISTSDGNLTSTVTMDTYKTAQDILNNYRADGNTVNVDPKNYLNNIVSIFGNLISSTQQNPKSIFSQQNITSLVSCTSKLEQVYDYNNTNKPNNLVTAKKFISLISNSLTSLIQFKNYIIGVDTTNLFNDQKATQDWWNNVLSAQAKFAQDWDNYIATNPNWNISWGSGRKTGNTINFPSVPSQGQSLSTVLSRVAQAASTNIPGLSSTTTKAQSLNFNIQQITDAIKNTRQASDTTMNVVKDLGQNITSIYYS